MDCILASAESLISLYDVVHVNPHSSCVPSMCKSIKLFSEWIKINTNAACGDVSLGSGLRVVAKNRDDHLLFARAVFSLVSSGVMLAKQMKYWKGLA